MSLNSLKHFQANFSLDERFYDDKWQKYSTFHCGTWGRCEHFCAPLALPYTCVQKGEVICLRFSSVHLPLHPPTAFPVSIFRLPPVESAISKEKSVLTRRGKVEIALIVKVLFFFWRREQRDIFSRGKNSNFEIKDRHLNLEELSLWVLQRSDMRPGVSFVRKTYFLDNDNEKGKYSDENSPIRARRTRVKDITSVCYLAIFFEMLYFYCRVTTVISDTRLSYIKNCLKYIVFANTCSRK